MGYKGLQNIFELWHFPPRDLKKFPAKTKNRIFLKIMKFFESSKILSPGDCPDYLPHFVSSKKFESHTSWVNYLALTIVNYLVLTDQILSFLTIIDHFLSENTEILTFLDQIGQDS